mgnify:CR=1 FL=1
MLLVIGNKNYSSWSLRPWVAMKVHGIAFDEKRILLDRPDTKQEILRHSPAGKVPCLVDGPLAVWDSLAILEYLAERHPGLWPADPAERARARSVSAEMHAGFAALRQHMGLNVRKRYPGVSALCAITASEFETIEYRHAVALANVKSAQVALERARQNLFWFLCGWLGGPEHYTSRFGHPRLKMRHIPFKIGIAERD